MVEGVIGGSSQSRSYTQNLFSMHSDMDSAYAIISRCGLARHEE